MVALLKEHVEIFVRLYQDMPGSYTDIAVHKLPLREDCPPVKQKPVPKKDEKVRMCVDYRDLNRASPKDEFPVLHIDVLVDGIAQCSVFSFMDGFFGQNQIERSPDDMKKTMFIAPWGTCCCR